MGLGGGDSGGPLFIDGRIAGIASFGTAFCADDACTGLAAPPLFDASHPDGWGSLDAFASVAYNAAWIRAQLGASGPTITPEPSTLVLSVVGVLCLVGLNSRARGGLCR
jgi:hypothetical protein